MSNTTALVGAPMFGHEIREGDRVAREHGWSSPITVFNPEPPNSFAAKMFGPDVRTAWMGDVPLGPIGNGELYMVYRPAKLAEVA